MASLMKRKSIKSSASASTVSGKERENNTAAVEHVPMRFHREVLRMTGLRDYLYRRPIKP